MSPLDPICFSHFWLCSTLLFGVLFLLLLLFQTWPIFRKPNSVLLEACLSWCGHILLKYIYFWDFWCVEKLKSIKFPTLCAKFEKCKSFSIIKSDVISFCHRTCSFNDKYQILFFISLWTISMWGVNQHHCCKSFPEAVTLMILLAAKY